MNGIANVWKIMKRISPRPGFWLGGERSGIDKSTAISISNAAYKNGSTASEATNRAVIAIPSGINLCATLIESEAANQKTTDP
jgi:hypothetical protein